MTSFKVAVYRVFVFCGGGGIGRIVPLARFACSFNISEMTLPSGTMIFVLFCSELVIVSNCMKVIAESLK